MINDTSEDVPLQHHNDQKDQSRDLVEQARSIVHEAVKTQEQRDKERPIVEKIRSEIPASFEEALQRVGRGIDAGINDVQSKFQARLEEGKPAEERREREKHLEANDPLNQAWGNLVRRTKSGLSGARTYVYEATKSADERWREKPAMEKVQDIMSNLKNKAEISADQTVETIKHLPQAVEEADQRKEEDTVDPTALLG